MGKVSPTGEYQRVGGSLLYILRDRMGRPNGRRGLRPTNVTPYSANLKSRKNERGGRDMGLIRNYVCTI